MINILFLGYSSSDTCLINFLKRKNFKVTHSNSKKILNLSKAMKFDLIISFGYSRIISKTVVKNVLRPIINLHMSYLPFNRGAHPNFWSFYENTIKGVTIHEINEKVDAGPIIYQKKIKFDLKKKQSTSFSQTYKILFKELEKLFMKNYKELISRSYKLKFNNISKGTIHKKKDLPKNFKDWDKNILSYLEKDR